MPLNEDQRAASTKTAQQLSQALKILDGIELEADLLFKYPFTAIKTCTSILHAVEEDMLYVAKMRDSDET